METITQQPLTYGFGSTSTVLPRGLDCLAELNELFIKRDFTKTFYGVMNEFTISDHEERELFLAKDDCKKELKRISGTAIVKTHSLPTEPKVFGNLIQGQRITKMFDSNGGAVIQLKETTSFCDASFQICAPNDRLMADIKPVYTSCIPIRRLFDSYGRAIATFRLLCFSGGCGEWVWQISDEEGNEAASLIFLHESCGTPRQFRLQFLVAMGTEKKVLLLGGSLFVILKYQSNEATDS